MKRIFVAIDISDEARSKVANYIETLRLAFPRVRVGWEETKKLHLTLKFLGRIEEKKLEDLQVIVENISKRISKYRLQISETGVFPNSRNPRVLWINVIDEQGNLAKINNVLEAECEKVGFQKETRKFVPHLTIGRVRQPNTAGDLARNHLKTVFEPVSFEVSEIVIYESILQPSGSNYRKVSSIRLI